MQPTPPPTNHPIALSFDRGTLVVHHLPSEHESLFPYLCWDKRVLKYRAPAFHYRALVLGLREQRLDYHDNAKQFGVQSFVAKEPISPRSHQSEALKAWSEQGARGCVVLPTGAGKTILAVLAIQQANRPTLIHVPTIDLMHQWYRTLTRYFGDCIGMLGGGERLIQPITVSTYESALLNVTHFGNQFGFVIFDECHHLPGKQRQDVAALSLAPFRLGLTATPDQDPQRQQLLDTLCGPICYQSDIRDLAGSTLAPYTVITKQVEFTPEEEESYRYHRQLYTDFLKENHLDFRAAGYSWHQFIRLAHRSETGRQAFQAYLVQKKLAQSSQNKFHLVWEILQKHASERILIFTQDNLTAYELGRRFFLPVLTHHTKVREREEFLNFFRSGKYRVLVTSKVLNEGVDVPEASVAVVFSGSGSVREHVQRLGRILRAQQDKTAVLYELVTAHTGEYFINQRRRDHSAYKETSEV